MNAAVFNSTGHPALNIPVGKLPPLDTRGTEPGLELPVGMQLVGRMFDEATLLQAGHTWEQAFDWRQNTNG